MTLDETLQSVWRQVLEDNLTSIEIGGEQVRVRHTSGGHLAQVDFTFEGRELRGLQQNPKTASRWAQLARAGKRVMQFLEGGRYIAVVVDGKVTLYGGSKRA